MIVSGRRYGFARPGLVRIFSVVDGLGFALARGARPRSASRTPRRILLVNLAHIGDVLMTTPAIAALRAAYPDAHLTMLVAPWAHDVVVNNPRLDQVVTYRPSWLDRERGNPYFVPGEFIGLIRHLRSGDFDCAVNFKSFFQENLACALAGIPRRVGHGIYGGGFLQTDLVPHRWGAHTVEQHLGLVEVLGARAVRPCLEIHPGPDHDRAAASLLDSARGSTRPRIALHVGAGTSAKMWPLERYALLAETLRERHGATLVFVGGQADVDSIERIRARIGEPLLVAAGRLTLLETAALMKRCAAFVGNDSGPAHIAAAVGLPALVIFSGTNEPAVWRPWGEHVAWVQERPFCAPCGLAVCNRNHECMTPITVEQVRVALTTLLNSGR